MSNMSNHLRAVFKDAFDRLRNGELKTLIPFLSLFRLNGKPMNLRLHYQFAPFYNCVQPPHLVAMTGRQVGKSYAIDSDCALRNMLIPFYHTLIVQPRADQIQRLIGTVYKPLVASCPIWDQFITSSELQKMSLRQFKNGSLCYAEHMFESPDRIRGISGVASCVYDETVSASTPILYAEFTPNMVVKSKPICCIKRGDFVFSFIHDTSDALVLSVAAKDASYHGVRQYYRITTLSGREITCTSDHSLHTSAGRMHLSEIIDYEFKRRHTDQRDSAKCSNGQPSGGCGFLNLVSCSMRNPLESRILPDGLRDAQAQHVTRIRSAASAEASESRIREILDSLESSQPWCISLTVLSDTPIRHYREACDEGVYDTDSSCGSTDMVVHGQLSEAEDHSDYCNLPGVRSRISEDDKKVLFSFLHRSYFVDCEETIRVAEQGSSARDVEAVEAASQGRNKRSSWQELRVDDAGAAVCSADIFKNVPCEEQGCQEGEEGGFFWDPILKIECVGELPGYDIEVEGTHNYILANGICSYNCQDLEYEYLDIASEVMSASLFWGFARYTGTPKTTDTTLALLWNRSSQAEWVIRCCHCGHFNIPNPEHDLLKMIGKSGPVCARCGNTVFPHNGGYVHAIPDRAQSFPGYHISQTVHPLHMINQGKWNKLLYKIETYPELTLYNEVYGWPYDAATSPLTMSDLQKATHDIKVESVSDFEKIADSYSYVTVAVDWSGGGMISDSYTSYAVLGLRHGSDVIDVLYGRRIPKGMSPTDEARELLSWISGTGADAFAYDNGGAGFTRLEIMNHEGLHDIPGLTIVPINYVRPHAGDVMVPRTGQREPDLYYYNLDKSRSLAVCIMSIKACRLRLPKFSEENEDAYQRDLLALREDPRVSLGNETVILIIKKPGVPDDFAHAVNFGASQIWDHFGAYPRIGTRYDASVLDFDENHKRIMDDETFGPRGDFDRFQDAVNQRADVIEPDTLW